MTDDQQMRDYLDEHLPYMLKMLRYTYGQMLQGQHYLSWNAHFELFAVHARNLVNFLTNSDTGNFKAHEFVRDFKARKGDIDGPMRKLEQQVFHLAKARPKDAVGKFNSEHAGRVGEWVEENFEDFLSKLSKLSPERRALFNNEKADPSMDKAMYITFGPTGPGAPPAACTASPIATHTTGEPQGPGRQPFGPKGPKFATTDEKPK